MVLVRPYLCAAVLLSCRCAAAQQFFNWNTFDVTLKPRQRFELNLHQRSRFSESAGVDQLRAGAVLRYALHRRATVFGGYYFQPQHTADDLWVRGHRLFTGVETVRPLPRSLAFTGRVAIERFIGSGRPDYNRYRSFLRVVMGGHAVAPYLQSETIAVRYGFHSMRNGGGLRLRVSPQVFLEIGGMYDNRQTEWGGDRVAIVSGVRWVPGDKR